MKEGLHPNYAPTQVKCACGAIIETASTKSDMRVDICSNCHPFFTGKQKLVDVLTDSIRNTTFQNKLYITLLNQAVSYHRLLVF